MENVSRINDFLIPKLNNFSEEVDRLLNSNKEMRQCIKKFDQDMLLKSNKSDLVVLKNIMED